MRRTRIAVLLLTVLVVVIATAGSIALFLAMEPAEYNDPGGGRAATDQRPSENGLTSVQVSSERENIDVALRKPSKKHLSQAFSLQSQSQIDVLLAAFPDISDVTDLRLQNIEVKTIPDGLLKQISVHGQNVVDFLVGIGGVSPGERAPMISEAGMDYISRLPKLERLCLACRCSAQGLAHLARMRELKTLGLDYPSISAKDIFETVSKMPRIQTLGIRYADFSQPIDQATYKAIASLNGRLTSLDLGEWQETTIHRSMLPAIAEIKSLTWLELGNVTATYDDFNPIRRSLLKLRHFGPQGEATRGIHIVAD